MLNYLQRSAGAFALVIAVAVLVWIAAQDALAQTAFEPCSSVALSSTEPNAPSDISSEFGIGLGADCDKGGGDDNPNQPNSGGLITFLPPEWNVAKSTDAPLGTPVGSFGSIAQLGLLNNPCNTILPVGFDLVNATIDRSNVIVPPVAGTANRLDILAQDSGNGVINGAAQWPDYLTTMGTDNDWDFSKLRSRLIGVNTTTIPGLTVVLNFLAFEPGTQLNDFINIDPVLGYPAITILQDPTQIASAQDPVSSFCAPLEVNAVISGQTNPGSGTYYFTTFVVALPDADGDGIENALDPCPYRDDPDFDPRSLSSVTPGDADGDGIPDTCDPFPGTRSLCTADSGIANTDEDYDGWMNRLDNCTVVANPLQEDDDSDSIGDACDLNQNVAPGTTRDGGFTFKCLVTKVTIGDGTGTQGVDPSTAQPCNPAAAFPLSGGGSPTPAPTPDAQGNTPTPGPGGGGGVGGGPDSGIGSLAPTGSDVPLWAVLLAAVAVLGVAGGLGLATRKRG